jgi:hypothetical protein
MRGLWGAHHGRKREEESGWLGPHRVSDLMALDVGPHEHERLDIGYMVVCQLCRKPLSPHLPERREYVPEDRLTGLPDYGDLNERRERAKRYEEKFGRRVGR